MPGRLQYIFLFFIFMGVSGFLSAQGPGDLMVAPKRITFEGNRLREKIHLINRGTDTAVYALSFVNYKMTRNGDFERVEKPDSGQYFAGEYVRFFPRRVQLPPNEVQIIRMQVRRSSDMKDREYRSHLYFRAVSQERPRGEEDPQQEESEGISVELRPVYGITIPVILRIGDLDAEMNISDVSLDREEGASPTLNFTLHRSGNRSVYGDITVVYQAEETDPVRVASARGMAVYTPNELRHFTMKLDQPEGVDFDEGSLVIRYETRESSNYDLSAEHRLSLD